MEKFEFIVGWVTIMGGLGGLIAYFASQMNKRFETVDKRFEAFREEMQPA